MLEWAMAKIPSSLIGIAGPVLAEAYTHSNLNSLFLTHGFPGDPPEGNKVDKCQHWMRLANRDCSDALSMFGGLIAEFMDADEPYRAYRLKEIERLEEGFSKEGLAYRRGGQIYGVSLSGPTRSLADRLKGSSLKELEAEYQRAYATVESDPPAAVTAACSIMESLCKTILEEDGVDLPSKQTLAPLWSATTKHLGLSPGEQIDDDIKRILQGLLSVADGVAALRTHAGSAHGRSSSTKTKRYKLADRHARLAVHAAHTMALFVWDTWNHRRASV